ncbi:MAG TPA: hypothetical protein VFI46_12795, partial [Jiangellaceae bacterium]|nr:hypothetical protein [Jiangellaceae bacterium]
RRSTPVFCSPSSKAASSRALASFSHHPLCRYAAFAGNHQPDSSRSSNTTTYLYQSVLHRRRWRIRHACTAK